MAFGSPVRLWPQASEGLKKGEKGTEGGIWLSLLTLFANVSVQLFLHSFPYLLIENF